MQRDFDTPRFVCFVPAPDGAIHGFVETVLEGVPLRWLKNNADHRPTAMEAIARVAAGVHRLPAAAFRFLPGHAGAAAHLDAELEAHDERLPRHDPDAGAATRWIRDHRSMDRPAVSLHGDLWPQNRLVGAGAERRGVVDWEYARRGDPAYDLALVTRGNRKPRGVDRGLHRLVATCREAGGAAIEPAEVVAWELVFVLGWLQGALRDAQGGVHAGHPPECYRNQPRSIQ